MANEIDKFLSSVAAGKKAAARMNFGVIRGAETSDVIGSDVHQSAAALDIRKDAFVFGIHLWGSDDHKVI